MKQRINTTAMAITVLATLSVFFSFLLGLFLRRCALLVDRSCVVFVPEWPSRHLDALIRWTFKYSAATKVVTKAKTAYVVPTDRDITFVHDIIEHCIYVDNTQNSSIYIRVIPRLKPIIEIEEKRRA